MEIIKRDIHPDYTVIVMSGNFTQRGEIAVLDKYTRASHAVLAGADAVIELPVIFSTANAEVFAKGAVSLINSVNGQKTLCFGAEKADKQNFLKVAKILSDETQKFKSLLKDGLKRGLSQVKARADAFKSLYGDIDDGIISSPNNLLGLEYTKAILNLKSDISIYPVLREGDGFNQKEITSFRPSALAIRSAISENRKEKIKNAVPSFVYEDLPNKLPNIDDFILYSILSSSEKDIKNIPDCSEGLENRIKSYAKTCFSCEELKEKVKTKRYTYSRISRIILSSALKIEKDILKKCLENPPYLNVLAVNGQKKEILSYLRSNSDIPVLTRVNDLSELSKLARDCFDKDVLANDIFAHAVKRNIKQFGIEIINA